MSTEGNLGGESTGSNGTLPGVESSKEGEEIVEAHEEVAQELNTVNKGIEAEVFGKWSVILRNVFGALTVFTLCLAALANAWTTNVSVTQKGEWPSEVSMIVMNIGPIIVAFTWMNASKVLTTILGEEGITTKIRSRLSDIIAPDKR